MFETAVEVREKYEHCQKEAKDPGNQAGSVNKVSRKSRVRDADVPGAVAGTQMMLPGDKMQQL